MSRNELLRREAELVARYDELAQAIAEEGAEDLKAMKASLKSGKAPNMTNTGRQLNATYNALKRVRTELAARPETIAGGQEPAVKTKEDLFTATRIADMTSRIDAAIAAEDAAEARKADMAARVDAAIAAEDAAQDQPEVPTDANPVLLTPDMKAGMPENLSNTPKQAEVEASSVAKVETAKNVIDPKENPLAPESMSAIVEALKKFGKKKDGKFATPAGFRDALTDAGFKLPVTVESEDVKNLHNAYKKAAFGKKKA